MTEPQRWRRSLSQKLHRVVEFLILQGITTAGNLFYGFLCVRLLPIGGYAKFAVVFGFLGSVTVLMDVGVSNTLAPLVAERVDDRQLIADYLAALRQVAQRLFVLIAPLTAVLFPLAVHKQQWPALTVAAMAAIILFSAWFARVSAAYGAVLILRRDRTRWYREQMVSSLGTLALLLVFWATHRLNAFVAILINVSGIVYLSQAYFFRARHLVGGEGHPTKRMRREIVHLALPNSTSTIFYALQGQLSLLLITIFGRTAAVASVGALTRLSQVFLLVAQMNPLLIEPFFARLPRERLKSNYLIALAAASGFAVGCILLAWVLPGIFLWILGPKYSHLSHEVLLMMMARAIAYVCGIMWTIHSARRFVYWWNNTMGIVVTLLIQVIFIWKVDLSIVSNVLLLNVVNSVAGVFVHGAVGIYGFVRGPRQLQEVSTEISAPEVTHA